MQTLNEISSQKRYTGIDNSCQILTLVTISFPHLSLTVTHSSTRRDHGYKRLKHTRNLMLSYERKLVD